VVGADVVQAAGGKVLLVDLVEGRSTTRLIDAIRSAPVANIHADGAARVRAGDAA
jgi:hypothetical protein